MRRIWALCWTGFSLVLASCQTKPTLSADALCSLQVIEVSEETRAHLRAPLAGGGPLPEGYGAFLRALAAHNAKIRTHCGRE